MEVTQHLASQKDTNMRFPTVALFSMIAISLAGCGQGAQQSNANGSTSQPTVTPTAAKTSPSERLLAAAEPFENLTEISFTASLPDIDVMIAQSRAAAASVRSLVSAAEASNTETLFKDIDQARKSQDRAGLALGSIEIYRGIVSSVPVGNKVPSAVSLLDYAGFRYQADLKAMPMRWSDAQDAMRYARSQWSAIAPQVKDAPLSASFEKALGDMEKAAATKNAALAESSATEELNLVDKLEIYFAAK